MSKVIYEPLVEEGYEWIHTVDRADYEVFLQLDGQPRASTWQPIAVRRVSPDEREHCNRSDFPWLGKDALILRRSAVVALRDILDANGELLPLSTADGVELCVLNARTVDALDEAHSSIIRSPETGRVMFVKKVAFLASKIRDLDLFRLPHRASSTYVSDRFVERVKTAGLQGLVFNKVWSD